nr:hypothetical protein [Tanacetum cinerariifolium]
MQTSHDAKEPATIPYDSPLLKVQSLGSVEGNLTLNELMVLYTKLSKRVADLQSDLQQTKLTYGAAYTKLILRVKKLEHKVKTSQHRRRARVIQEDYEIQGRTNVDTKILLHQEEPAELVEDLGSGEKGEKKLVLSFLKLVLLLKNLVYIRRSAEKRKDKGKATMKEDKYVQKKSRKQLKQERLGHEEAIRLQEQIFKKERQRIARDAKIAKQLQEAIAEAASAHDIDWNDPAVLRYHALQNRSFFVAEQFAKEVSEKKDDSSSKPVRGSRKKTVAMKRIGAKLDEESDKRQKLKDVTKEATIEYEKEKEELRLKYQLLGKIEAKDIEVYKFTRADESSSYHGNVQAFLRRIDRKDLNDLYSLVQERFQDHPLKGHDLLLWGDLRMIFVPDENDKQ